MCSKHYVKNENCLYSEALNVASSWCGKCVAEDGVVMKGERIINAKLIIGEEEDKLNMDFSCFKAFRPGRLLLLNEPLCSISHHGHGGPAITLAIEGSH
jgi:hypothetical protein